MPTLENIISRGYFPRELPPPFTSSSFGTFSVSNHSSLLSLFQRHHEPGKLLSHNLARSGSLRRKLGVPNPIYFYQLASFIIDNWQTLHSNASRSRFSLTSPVDGTLSRAIERQYSLTERPIRRAQLRSTSRYILHADISRFYPSIYTHSIPWAMHTKSVAKADRSNRLIGNNLDRLVRNAQDAQTLGIPIGPDTSLLIAEIILGAIDVELSQRAIVNGFRYMDDYEFGFMTLSEAEESLAIFQEVLNAYELALNPNKTKIIKLPMPTDSLAISELRSFGFRASIAGQESDILRYFDRAFVLSNESPEEGILKYAISRLSGEEFHLSNWGLLENLLCQCFMAEPGAIAFVLNQMLRYMELGCNIDRDRVGHALDRTICQHAPLGHGSEVAWALWSHLALTMPISAQSVRVGLEMNDSIVALLLLDANLKGLLPADSDFTALQAVMSQEDLYGEHWLLSYEANVKGWLPSADVVDHVAADTCFSLLKRNGVHFYDDSLSEGTVYEPPAGWSERY